MLKIRGRFDIDEERQREEWLEIIHYQDLISENPNGFFYHKLYK